MSHHNNTHMKEEGENVGSPSRKRRSHEYEKKPGEVVFPPIIFKDISELNKRRKSIDIVASTIAHTLPPPKIMDDGTINNKQAVPEEDTPKSPTHK
mmetsp:Transcript_23853/g.33436  ORF Transcript_23853/g.33436 Transcript_23853/m.33436 type:complete len:96 (-) Transcript_23853:272-559(-)